MTIPRFLLITGLLIGSILGVLAFGNPQWKWCYIVQSQINGMIHIEDGSASNFHYRVDPPDDYVGLWKHWRSNGSLSAMASYDGTGDGMPIFNDNWAIDRRAEFGIPIE